jgi:hypothetical protein
VIPVCYITLQQARDLLSEMGVEVSLKQLYRATEPNAEGKRRLPFFPDPVDGLLKIEKGTLVRIYRERQLAAERDAIALTDNDERW